MRVVVVAHLIDNLPRALAEGAEGAESERAVVQVPMQLLLVHDLVVVANLLLVVAVSTVATLHLRLRQSALLKRRSRHQWTNRGENVRVLRDEVQAVVPAA